ncbi:hypothetical protein JPSP30_23990 [Staphylococcus pseudintermedius]
MPSIPGAPLFFLTFLIAFSIFSGHSRHRIIYYVELGSHVLQIDPSYIALV